MLDKFLKNPSNRRIFLLKTILFILLAFSVLSGFLAVLGAKKSQKTSVLENAASYAGIMDQHNAMQEPADGSGYPEDGLTGELPSASSLSTLAVLKDGRVLSTEGYSPLSWKLVADVSELARTASLEASAPSEAVYAYHTSSLPGFYFCYVPSRIDGLGYCYYEPVLAGWPLARQAFSNIWGVLLLLLSAAMLPVLFLLLVSSGKGIEHPAQAAALSRDAAPGDADLQAHAPGDMVSQAEAPEDTSPRSLKCASEKNGIPRKEKQDNAEVFGSRPYFSGIIIDYYNMNGASVSPDILELFDQIIRENLSVNKILFQFSSQRSSDCLQYYMNYDNYNLRVLCDSLKMNLYNAAPEYAINIFYSDAVTTRQEMENELLYLHRQLRYSLLLGYGLRFSISQIRSFETSPEKMDAGVASTIQNHLRTRAYEDLYAYLRRCRDICTHFARPSSTRYSFSEMYRFAEESFSAVKLFFQENAFSHPMTDSSCRTVLRSNPGLGHFCDYLISCIQSYQQENQHVLSSRNEQIMNSIYMYIEQDLADANLNSIARKMQMTDSHLSRVFKKNTGTNFSEYLSGRKLEEAAKLLVQDDKIKVADIADKLGYGNPTYFLSRFKAKYGVSPTAYRKLHVTK